MPESAPAVHCHVSLEKGPGSDNSHVFRDYSHLFLDRTRALWAVAEESGLTIDQSDAGQKRPSDGLIGCRRMSADPVVEAPQPAFERHCRRFSSCRHAHAGSAYRMGTKKRTDGYPIPNMLVVIPEMLRVVRSGPSVSENMRAGLSPGR